MVHGEEAQSAADTRDTVVIGSGFGGAVAALRLVEAGLSTTLLERGRRYPPGDFPMTEAFPTMRDLPRIAWPLHRGVWDVQDLRGLVTLQAAGYGGGSLVYANVHMRPPAEAFESWPFGLGRRGGETWNGTLDSDLDPYYDVAAYMLEVGPDATETVKNREFTHAAREVGWEHRVFAPNLAVNFDASAAPPDVPTEADPKGGADNRFGVRLGACVRCNACFQGCNYGAKNTLDKNYLAEAERLGLEVRTSAEVTELTKYDSRWRVSYSDHRLGARRFVYARYVFICAGALGTVRLLSSLDRDSARGSGLAHIGSKFFANADQLAAVFGASESGDYCQPTITRSLLFTEPTGGADAWFMIQDAGVPPHYLGLANYLEPDLVAPDLDLSRHPEPEGLSLTKDPAEIDLQSPNLLRVILRLLDVAGDGMAPERGKSSIDSAVLPLQLRALLEHVVTVSRDTEVAIRSRLRTVIVEELKAHARRVWAGGPVRDLFVRLGGALAEGVVSRLLAASGSDGRTGLESVYAAATRELTRLARQLVVFDERVRNRHVLLLMGRDPAPGRLRFERLDTSELGPSGRPPKLIYTGEPVGARLYERQVRALDHFAREGFGGEVVLNPSYGLLQKPLTVHGHGGAVMGPEGKGVVDALGRVHGHDDLFVLDASILPESVGVNPSATILAVAERAMHGLLPLLECADGSKPDPSHANNTREAARAWVAEVEARTGQPFEPLDAVNTTEPTMAPGKPPALRFSERMSGFVGPINHMGAVDRPFEAAERAGRRLGHEGFVRLEIGSVEIDDVPAYLDDPDRVAAIRKASLTIGGRVYSNLTSGCIRLGVFEQRGSADSIEAVFLRYDLAWSGDDESDAIALEGYKVVQDDQGFDYISDVTTLLTTVSRGASHEDSWKGILRVSLSDFSTVQLPSFVLEHGPESLRERLLLQFMVDFLGRTTLPFIQPRLLSMVRDLIGQTKEVQR